MEQGKIIKIISNQYDVRLNSGETVTCVAMGKLRKSHSPIVGDYVEVERFDGSIGIQKILSRRNELRRPSNCKCRSGNYRDVNCDSRFLFAVNRQIDFSDLLSGTSRFFVLPKWI